MEYIDIEENDKELIEAATNVIQKNFLLGRHHVGAAVRAKSGKIYSAVHLDSKKVDVCAEQVALGMAVAAGEREFEMIVAVQMRGVTKPTIIAPCQFCRELINFYSPEMWVISKENDKIKKCIIKNLVPSDNDYFKNLPKKRMGAGVLIFNSAREILFVKTRYKDYWSLPGGVVEDNESPRKAAEREVLEEIGLRLRELNFLCLDYISGADGHGENLQFIFFGGELREEEIKNIKLEAKEISEYKFMKLADAIVITNEKLKKRLPKCLAALKDKTVVYLEDGKQ